MTEDVERMCCYECKPIHPPTTQATIPTSSVSPMTTTTLPQKCPESCCLAHANMKINSEKKGAIEWTSRPGSELVEFAVSPKDSGNVAIEVDFSKTIEITGFQVSSSIKSFQISYKKDVVGSAFIPYVSDVTGDPYTFNVNRNGKVFLPDMDSVLARWLKISPVRLGSDSVQDVVFDVLGCAGVHHCNRCLVL